MQSSSRSKVPRLSAEDPLRSRAAARVLAVESFEWPWMEVMSAVKIEVGW